MKKLLFVFPFLLSGILAQGAAVTLNMFVGQLVGSNGTTPLPDGALIQIIASTTDSVFAAPTAGSFTGGSADDLVVATFAVNSTTTGQAGVTFDSVTTISLGGSWNPGDALLLRWWPTLTTASSSPSLGTAYGEFRSDSLLDGSDIAWITPADGSTSALNFVTVSAGGSQPNSLGAATQSVVPEPTTFGLLGAAGMFALLRRRRA